MTSENGPTITSPIVVGGEAPSVESPVVTTNPEPPAPVTDPAATPPVADPVAPAAPDPAATASKTTPEWAQKRINELTASRYAAERAEAAEREKRVAAEKTASDLLAKLAGGGTPPTEPTTPAKPTLSDAEIEKLVNDKAAAIAAANDFNKACNNIVEQGKKEFSTWDDAVKNLTMVGAIGQGAPLDFLENAIELKNPASVLNHLGQNMDEAERIAKLPARKMALEMARLEAQLNAPKPEPKPAPVSNAPAPVIPVGGAAKPPAVDINDPNISTADFMRLRAEQREEKMRGYRKAN